MPVTSTCRSLLFVAALVALWAGALAAQQGESSASLDLYIFNQDDNGGNPVQNEELLYMGVRVSAKLKISKVLSIRPTASVAQLETGGKTDVPSTITNATTTSASQKSSSKAGGKSTYTPITTSLGFDIKPANTTWTFSPGLFFSYQDNYISRGLDFAVSAEFFNGNTIPSLSYGLRWDSLSATGTGAGAILGAGEGEEEEEDEDEGGGGAVEKRLETRLTHNLQLGFTQILSPQWRLNASFQYTRQDGFLGAPNAVITLYRGATPILFANENLPHDRNRFQFNVRVRYAPVLHFGLGMDHSFYFDDWGVTHFALEPNAEGPIVVGICRWRVWYRFSYQSGTNYERHRPQNEFKYQTDDPDLATFTTHSGGVLFYLDLARFGAVHWSLRVSGYGNYRDDGISGFGGMLGTEFDW